MKPFSALAILLPSLAMGQSLVSTSPQNRTVIIEDLTGVNCQYCPDGHTIMAAIHAAEPNRVVPLAVHAGSFATAAWTTTWGNAINSFYNPDGYPSGGVNRRQFNGTRALDRGSWTGAAQQVLALSSPVNLGLASAYDSETRVLTITVELLYTANSPVAAADRLSVLLAESGIVAAQASTSGTISNYTHNHVFRASITPTWGDQITATTAGDTQTLTYTYTMPATWNPERFEVIAMIGENQSDVYQARSVAAVGGTTLSIGNLAEPAGRHAAGTTGTATTFTSALSSSFEEQAGFRVTLEAVSAPAGWNGSFAVAGNSYEGSTVVSLDGLAAEDITVSITPGTTAGIGKYRLTVEADGMSAPALRYEVSVISGVTDLVVSNAEAPATTAEVRYLNGLSLAGNTTYAKMNREEMVTFFQAGALGGIINIYRNVSWTFPSLTDAEVAALSSMMDNGVNLMIAGQDIGWDQSGASQAYGTAATRAFYRDYMLATFVNDGTSADTPVNFVDGDEVFGGLADAAIANAFSGNTYPDQITPRAPATAIFKYGTTEKIGGLRAQTANHKLVYLGVGPEQFSSVAIARNVVKLSHDWFYGLVSVEEFEARIGGLGQPWPVPADRTLSVPVDLKTAARLTLHDATGRVVLERAVAAGTPIVDLNTSALSNGSYFLRLQTSDGHGEARRIVVAH